jgi:dihydroorotase-like cyclic amidohydrolase
MPQTAIANVLLFNGEVFSEQSTVVFDSSTGLITSVSTSSSSPQDATTVDGSGMTLLPGLIDAHVHSYGLHLPPGSDIQCVLTDPLRCGVTTICDMHSDPDTVYEHQRNERSDVENARKKGKDGRVTRASVKSAHYAATIEGGWPVPIVMANHPTDEVSPCSHHAGKSLCRRICPLGHAPVG